MTDIEIIDQFLKVLYESGSKPRSLEPIVKDKARRHRIETTMIGEDLMVEMTSMVSGHRYFILSANGIDIINEHGSYTSFCTIKSKEQTNARHLNYLTVIGAVFGIVGIGWGIFEDIRNSRLKTNNEELKITIDSLTYEIERRQVYLPPDTIDIPIGEEK